jgi:two-component system, NarL family, sensor histidine kinase LiaS
MEPLLKFFRLFQGLRGRLILTYTLTTVLALLALELLFLGGVFAIWLVNNDDHNHYLTDVHFWMGQQAGKYLVPGQEDLEGLQDWLDSVYQEGYASLPPQNSLDSPAAPVVRQEGLFVISPKSTILAHSPRTSNSLIGQPYAAPEKEFVQGPLAAALASQNYRGHFTRTRLGSYRLAVPIFPLASPQSPPYPYPDQSSHLGDASSPTSIRSDTAAAVVILAVEPPPPLYTLWPTVRAGLGILFLTGLGLLLAVTPFGALFGFIMSRSLTRRLGELTRAADAWSEGDFSVVPKVRGKDEIGLLSLRMRHMAERIQILVQSQQELTLMEERNRLARDLHDTVKQQTFATLMQLRAALNRLESSPAEARASLEQAESLIKTAQQDLGLIIAELRPAMLDGQGLAAALSTYLNTWSQHTRIPSSFEATGERSLPLDIEQTLFRVTQEALSNAARHSSASRLEVRLDYQPEQVSMEIFDNGQGFDPLNQAGRGFGLVSMKQRVEATGGHFNLKTALEEGVCIQVVIPLKPQVRLPENS